MAESPPCHELVPLLKVSPCVTPHVANQNMTSNETDKDIKDISGFHEKCKCILFVTIAFKFLNHHLHARLLLNYSSLNPINTNFSRIIPNKILKIFVANRTSQK